MIILLGKGLSKHKKQQTGSSSNDSYAKFVLEFRWQKEQRICKKKEFCLLNHLERRRGIFWGGLQLILQKI